MRRSIDDTDKRLKYGAKTESQKGFIARASGKPVRTHKNHERKIIFFNNISKSSKMKFDICPGRHKKLHFDEPSKDVDYASLMPNHFKISKVRTFAI